jgi:hypothetical protein
VCSIPLALPRAATSPSASASVALVILFQRACIACVFRRLRVAPFSDLANGRSLTPADTRCHGGRRRGECAGGGARAATE